MKALNRYSSIVVSWALHLVPPPTLMVQFQDEDGFLVTLGMPAVVIGWLAVLFRVSTIQVLAAEVSYLPSVFLYFFLHSQWPETFSTHGAMMAVIVVFMCLSVGVALVVGVLGLLYGAIMIGAIPVFYHNAQLLSQWTTMPDWAPYAILVGMLVVLAALLYKIHFSTVMSLLLGIPITSFCLQVMIRVWYLEENGDAPYHHLECSFSSSDTHLGRCPFSFDSATWLGVLVGLAALQGLVIFVRYWRREHKERVDKETKPKKKTKKKDRQDKKDEQEVKAPSFGQKVMGKARKSPSPPPPSPPLSSSTGSRGYYQRPVSAHVEIPTTPPSSSSDEEEEEKTVEEESSSSEAPEESSSEQESE